ncbi:DUF1501 domain-containing protein [Gemmata sp. JC717]|uniref:DUF1501 domain-containing protein n=1 Tax=Gemmata algarum TaxID=2975278 RepID=UPI0021BBA1D3|nr:DUF1501 domain-containing protein [Gemmata algarum]MDY3553890.1 DUF1501 domain-containing protein [Gemmata algarum]
MSTNLTAAPTRAPGRREFLRVGVVGSLGLTLGDFFALKARADQKNYASKEGVAKSVIQIVLPGGMAHQESWDPKPDAPLEYRGPFNVAKTKLPGVVLSENFRSVAQVADKMTIVRSIAGKEADHGRASYTMFTGYRKSPALEHPAMGAVVSHEFGPRRDLPPYVAVPSASEYGGTGYLGSQFGPFGIGSDPARSGYKVRDLTLPPGVDDRRFGTRQQIRGVVDDHFRAQAKNAEALGAMDEFYARAYALISSSAAREAFDIEKESAATRAKYGPSDAGPRFLLARRLVEAGVRFVTVSYGGWDMHAGIESAMKRQAPGLDAALAGLIRDLDDRGLLASTVVLVTSEFGRTPKINASAGRDHFPRVFSLAVAGGGFKKGLVYGSSNSTASEPEEDPVRVEDVLTTVYHQLGINADKELMAPGARPIEIIDDGKVVKDLIG